MVRPFPMHPFMMHVFAFSIALACYLTIEAMTLLRTKVCVCTLLGLNGIENPTGAHWNKLNL